MSSRILAIKNYLKRAVWLAPLLVTSIFAIYFVNIFTRIDEIQYKRQLLQRNAFVEFAGFIDSKFELYTYLDLIDQFEDNNIYLLNSSFEIPVDKKHAANCPYVLTPTQHAFELEEFQQLMKDSKFGVFTHQVDDETKIDFNYKYLTVEDRTYVLLIGIHKYPTTTEELELQWAIGFLLLLTSIANFLIVMYAKHVRYLQLHYNKRK